MRIGLLCLCLAAGGCGELQGASTFTESPGVDAGTEVAPKDGRAPGANDLDGYYVDEIIPATVALFRLDRKSAPTQPWIVIVSSASAATISCETFKVSDWSKRLPPEAMFHVIELGTASTGSFVVRAVSPPAADGAAVGRGYPSATPVKLARATSGSVTVERTDATGSRGSFDVTFQVLYEDDPLPYDQRVRGLFDAPACAVD